MARSAALLVKKGVQSAARSRFCMYELFGTFGNINACQNHGNGCFILQINVLGTSFCCNRRALVVPYP